MSDSKRTFLMSNDENPPSGQPLELYHLAHDLRGPLNSVMGFSELLIDGVEGPLNEYQFADITAIYQSAGNLLRLINAIVDLSKLEANLFQLTKGKVLLSKAIGNIIDYEYGTDKPDRITLNADLPDDLPTVYGQFDRVELMVANLVRFGFKLQTSQISITTEHDEDTVTVMVHIAGVYIPSDELKQMFELVATTDKNGRTHLTKGRVELPLARGLAEAHDGKLWAESNEESGTMFYLQLPQYPKE
ncbi:HAMP domain-containing sensor histidine kinase [Anaerolineales bacterium HSG25]|nr:HAMP domain-containing sensor histidine kinase [Anaerolineales bacterium HSG25]